MVAPLRIRRDANWGNSLGQQRDPTGEPAFHLGQAQPGADVDEVVADLEPAEFRQPVDSDGQTRAGVPDVQLDAPVRRAGDQPGVGMIGEQGQRLVEVTGTDETAVAAVDAGRWRRRRRPTHPGVQRIGAMGRAERVGGVPDRPVTRAAAQVSGQRVQVEAVRPVLVVRRLRRGRSGRARRRSSVPRPPRGPFPRPAPPPRPGARVRSRRAAGPNGRTPPPSSRRNPVCSSRIASRRGSAISRCTGCSRSGAPRPSAVTTSWCSRPAAGTRQALIAVHRVPVVAVGSGDQHGAGAALALGAALLAAGEPRRPQPLEERDVAADVARAGESVR